MMNCIHWPSWFQCPKKVCRVGLINVVLISNLTTNLERARDSAHNFSVKFSPCVYVAIDAA